MAKRVRKGVGMTERVVIERNSSDFPDRQGFADAFSDSLDALEAHCIPRNVRAETAKRCHVILEKGGLRPGEVESERRLMEYAEDRPERLAGEWLRTLRHVESLKAKVEGGQASAVMDLIDEAERLGVIQERFWWRCGADYSTGERREGMAVKSLERSRFTKRGHERVHGDDIAKHARWSAMSAQFHQLVSDGRMKKEAYSIVAEDHNVSTKTVERAVKWQENQQTV